MSARSEEPAARISRPSGVRRSMLITAVALIAVLTACGSATTAENPTDSPSNPGEEPFAISNGEVLLSCGGDGPGWAPSVMTEGVPAVLSDDEASDIFDDILSDPMTGEEATLGLFPDVADVDWRILHANEDALTIGLGRWTEQGPTDDGADILELEREGATWRAAGWGDCQLSPVLKEGNSWAEVTGYKGDAQSVQLKALVHERECTSGRDPEGFLHEPFVVETNDKVTIYWTSEPPEGAQSCQGNPSIERVVELQQQLGSRPVFDGFSYPPLEIRAR